jgi:transposase
MQLKTLLNRVHPVKGFVYQDEQVVLDKSAANGWRLEVQLRARRGSRGICSGCGKAGGTYDHLPVRRFEFVPLWGIAVVLLCALRRIDCRGCGVKVEQVPWCEAGSKSPRTIALSVFLSRWAKLLSWKQVAVMFAVSWEAVYRSVEQVVAYGLKQRDLSGISAIGVDEVAWRAYLKVIARKLPDAMHILDRYHIVANLNKALDQVRAEESKKLRKGGWDILKGSRWLLLRRRKRLTGRQRFKLRFCNGI